MDNFNYKKYLAEGRLFEENFKNPILDKYLELKKSIDYKTVFPTDLQSFVDSLDNTERDGLENDLAEGVTADEIASRVRKLGKEKGIEDEYIEDYIDELDGNFEPDAYENSTDKDLLDDLKSYIDLSEGRLFEDEEDQFGDELDAFADDLADEIKDELEDHKEDIQKSDKELNEVVGVVGIIGYILLSNTIANMLSKFAKKQFAKRDFGKGEAAAKKIYDFTHKNEEAFKAQIRRIVGIFTKDVKKKKMISDILFAIVVLAMAGQAGGEAVSYLKKAGYLKGGLYGLKAAVKGTEVSNIIKSVVQDAVS